MKKLLSFSLLSLFILSLLAISASSQDADGILKRIIRAQGGRELLESLKHITTTVDMELTQMGISGTGTMTWKEPNKARIDMEFMGMMITRSFDGVTAWVTNPQTGMVENMPEAVTETIRCSSFGNSALLDPSKYGIEYTYKGKENVEGKDYLALDQVHSGGYTISLYIDPDTYLIYMAKADSFDQMMTEVVEEIIMSDYKKVEGVMIPYVQTILQDGTEYGTITITGVEFNKGLKDSFFKKEETTTH
jgi:outer membrane lipoprotein-sorting protein